MKQVSKAKVTETTNTVRLILAVVVVALALAYLVWPIDLIPDVIPVIGWIDDLIVIGVAVVFAMNQWR